MIIENDIYFAHIWVNRDNSVCAQSLKLIKAKTIKQLFNKVFCHFFKNKYDFYVIHIYTEKDKHFERSFVVSYKEKSLKQISITPY